MNRETIRDYLFRSEMNVTQAEALSNIFAEMARRSDLRTLSTTLDVRMESFEERIDSRFLSFEKRMDARFRAFEEKMDARFRAFEEKMDEKMTGGMAQLRADLTWRMIAIVGFFGTVITVLNAFIG